MKKPDMLLIIFDTAFAVILGLLALGSSVIWALFNRPDQLIVAALCLPVIWALVCEIKSEINRNR